MLDNLLTPLGILSLVIFLYYFSNALEFIYGSFIIKSLADVPPLEGSSLPKVSIIIPARNEEKNIEEALQTVLNIDYPAKQIIVLNDRSEDSTGRILQRVAEQNPSLKVVNITELPKDWMGKNYALHTGAMSAEGEYLLFTDADVMMQPDVLRRAMSYVTQNKIDHFSMMPEVIVPGAFFDTFITTFEILFSMHMKPWYVRNPKSKRYIGIGAFNMMRADAYRKTGGFGAIRLRPDDDIKLGKLAKDNGYKSDFVNGSGKVSVKWYENFRELTNGFYKNMFAGLNYNFLRALAASIGLPVIAGFPFIAVLLSFFFPVSLPAFGGIIFMLNLFSVLSIFIIYLISERFDFKKGLLFITFPVTATMFILILLRSVFLTYKNKGIIWRGTHYNLKELKNSDYSAA
jgi:cellulose synthase/poly-beta-1,6-N-acetylglucosamine synthase-like glycosyltransferase